MPIPSVSKFRIPLLNLLSDGQERSLADAATALADHFSLTPEDRSAVIPSSGYSVVRHRTAWAGFHLRKAGLVVDGLPGVLRITEEGKALAAKKPHDLSNGALSRIPAYQAWKAAVSRARNEPLTNSEGEEEETASPEEEIANAYAKLRSNLAADLIERIKAKPSRFFERLVVDLLLAMGYGGSRAEAGTVTKASGDGGIDGVIAEDRLGLDAVYVQAKRWNDTVGVEQVRGFAGALSEHKAQKGVFITTSDFARGARDYVEKITQKIVLIDGARLAELMIDYGVGVQPKQLYELKRADEDYFAEE